MKYEETLVENTYVLCKNGKLIIPITLQYKKISLEICVPLNVCVSIYGVLV